MGKILKSNSTAKSPHETRENNDTTLQTRMHRVAVQIASSSIGQTMMMQFDKLLWTLEKTATWISNGKTGDGKRVKTSIGLVRPLPWVFFLPTLVALRFVRVVLSLVAICVGFEEIEASMMVSFLHKSRRNMRHISVEARRNNKSQISCADYVKRITLTLLTQLSNFISQNPNDTTNKTTNKMKYNNKTALNALVITETENDDQTTSQSEESDLEEKMYRTFLKAELASSDSDDKDYIYDEMSNEDSETSAATDDFSDDDFKSSSNEAPLNGTNGSTVHFADTNYSADTSTIAVVDPPQEDLHDDQSSEKENDGQIDASDRLFREGEDAKDGSQNRGKNVNRTHKNGRNHAKNHNNGKQFNGAHGQAKNKTAAKHHQVESTTDFIADATAADRT
ncbi:uncharacterized protein LOC116337730 [Contarinia nasturtii]|uniref:uncharacterized protein LOC116337730 n=1 Tax=Contarinia nasturtii TaxID=265458 RepID=UPI0012D428E1|nr:uncharacterized protein LOC116337730 [Contarinia nasturtii]XP_031618415.1 uncharacterized protein LOC116337730 [Contarinia nasturtii]XP_031618416.1 uncharacterized protein LOC116337730 [Contarinia nasturtii]